MATYNLFGAAEPTSAPPVATGTVNDFSMSTEFGVTSPCWVTQLRFHRQTTGITGTITGGIYTVATATTGALVSGTFVTYTVSGTGWQTATLANPIYLTPGQRYRVINEFAGNSYEITSGYFTTGPGATTSTNGPLTLYSHDDALGNVQGGSSVTSVLSYTTNASSGDNYWSDLTVTDVNPYTDGSYNIFGTGHTGATFVGSGAGGTLGTEFYVATPSWVTGFRFYRSSTTITGTIRGRIYQVNQSNTNTVSGGTALGTLTNFTLSGTGWQELTLATPLALTPGQPYRIVIFFPSGRPDTANYWTSIGDMTNGPLVAPTWTNATGSVNATPAGNQETFDVVAGASAITFPNTGNTQHGNSWCDINITTINPFITSITGTTETYHVTDSSSLSATPGPSGETAAVTDSSSLSASSATTDTASFSETSSVNKLTTDSATVTDSSALYQTTNLSTTDSATVTEGTSTSSVTDTTSDTSTVTETSQASASFAKTDTASFSESSSLLAMFNSTDSATTTDASQPINTSTQATGSETYHVTETSSLSVTVNTSDDATFADGETQSKDLSSADSATVTDSSALFVTLDQTDSINAAETHLPINDSTQTVGFETYHIQESIAITSDINLFDSTGFTDESLVEPIVPITSPGGDSVTFTDQANVYELQRYTEDVIVYQDAKNPNRNFRVIAQDHFTREFIHWDLPLDNVTVTYNLSGPNLLSGVISSEMESIMSLDPPLMPDRTWLHLEEDGEIRGSFILTPFLDSPQTQTRTVEGEGFSTYPSWVTYEGNSFVGIQIDPADMVRKLWDHVQSYTDGNLGVKVSPTKTPIKLGTPPEAVDFTTNEGVNVNFQAGPYTLNYWSVTNCGEEITQLCTQTPIDFIEDSQWNATKTDVNHNLVMGYPRIGTKRTDLSFREGDNLTQLIPSYQGSNDNYASEVIVIGAGTGPTAIRAIKAGRIGLLRKTNVIQNQDITNHSRAQSLADYEFSRIAHSRFLIESITVDMTKPGSLWGTFAQGDDILVQANVLYVGYIQDWYRIVSFQYDPYNKIGVLTLEPSDSFTYGAENVDPYDELPTAGFAQLSQVQDFTQALTTDDTSSAPDGTQLDAYVTQNAQQYLCAYFNKNGLKNGFCLYWYWDAKQLSPSPQLLSTYKWQIGPLEDLNQLTNFLVVGKTDYGHIITGDNIVLVAPDGSIGQQQNTTSIVSYPNPYLPTNTVPVDTNSTIGSFTITDTDQSTGFKAVVFKLRQQGLQQFISTDLELNQAIYYRPAADQSISLQLGTINSMGADDVMIIQRAPDGTLSVGAGIQINDGPAQVSGLVQAAQFILARMQSGESLGIDWSWAGMPYIVGQYNYILLEKYAGYHNMKSDMFLTAVISGQIN
jgi:hypothetical protein